MSNYIIIGASSGIGKTLAESLSKSGNQVWGTYNKTKPEESNHIKYHKLNVLDDQVDMSFVPDTVDGLAYCPGSINLKPFMRIKPEEFIKDYELQLVGAIKVIQATLGSLKKSPHASVILFSTVAVQTGFSFHSQVSSSKGAIEGLTRALAAELAPDVRFNCIAPSLTNTPLAAKILSNQDRITANNERHPLKRIGEAEDVANAASFLLSKDSGWITGQVMPVDGGMSSLRL